MPAVTSELALLKEFHMTCSTLVKTIVLSTAMIALAGAVGADELPVAKLLPMAIARDIASAAIDKCRADGFRVTVVVADRFGQPIVMLRDDGTGPHTVESARRKAYTAASMRTSTRELSERLVKNPGSSALATLTDVITLAGGLPIKSGEEVIGSAGAGGAPGGDKDEACVQAGLDAVAARLK
jgi:uncharacterized protein GlcG (DUF336 family)